MTLLRNIFSDLVEKRLWPLAVVLIVLVLVVVLPIQRLTREEPR